MTNAVRNALDAVVLPPVENWRERALAVARGICLAAHGQEAVAITACCVAEVYGLAPLAKA